MSKSRAQMVADLRAAEEDLLRAVRRVKRCTDALVRDGAAKAQPEPSVPSVSLPLPELSARPEALLAIWPDASRALGGIGRTKLYELIASGELSTVKIGRRRFVPASAIEGYVTGLRSA